MSILKRIQSILAGNINDLLDKVEDPETAVNQMIRDMEEAMSEMRNNTASAIATAKMTEKKLVKAGKEQQLWQQNAETALKSGDEKLAKKALLKRKTVDNSIEILEGQLEDARNIAEKMKEELKFLEAKLSEAKIKRDNLVNQQRAAETKQKLYDAADKVNRQLDSFTAAEKVLEGFEGFARFEEKIEKQMAEIEAREELSDDSLDREFQKMERDRELEAELAALKEKIGR
ncbi:PspA/IM30 family protein [Thermodesulfobacteriota bacterium]